MGVVLGDDPPQRGLLIQRCLHDENGASTINHWAIHWDFLDSSVCTPIIWLGGDPPLLILARLARLAKGVTKLHNIVYGC